MDYVLLIASLAALALATLWIRQLLGSQSPLPLPPGPKGLPILGNLLDLAGGEMNVKCRDWSRQFGMLLSLAVVFPCLPAYLSRLQGTISSHSTFSATP